MKAISIIILLSMIYISSASFGRLFSRCSNITCSVYHRECKKDTVCITAFTCLENCTSSNTTCIPDCYESTYNDTEFWALEFCNADCVAHAVQKNSTNKAQLTSCMDECNTDACAIDPDCEETFECMQLCVDGDYNCLGECAVTNPDNKNFFSLAECVNQSKSSIQYDRKLEFNQNKKQLKKSKGLALIVPCNIY